MILGCAKTIITPQKPLRLCGYGFREDVYETVREDITCRVFDLRRGDVRVLFIYGDLLWWNSDFVRRVRPQLAERLGIPVHHLFFVASHNHSGPGTGTTFVPMLETVDDPYVTHLEELVYQTVQDAADNLEEVSITHSIGESALNVYRRTKGDGGIDMQPNYDVRPDRKLTVLDFHRQDKNLKGRMIHYACHANVSKDNELHPDYPGYALKMTDEAHPGCISMFLQGCTADLRPNCVMGTQFRAGDREDVVSFATQFFEAAEKTTKTGIKEVVEDTLSVACREVSLPLVRNFTPEDMDRIGTDDPPEKRQWAQKIKERGFPASEMLEIGLLRLGQWRMFFMNAEMSMRYAAIARAQYERSICTAYTNGMIGYVCSAEQIKEGGYEPAESATYFALAGTYSTEVEALITEAMEELR